MRIFLVGYMGSGKSTIGKQLAKKLMFRFVDIDKYIEQKLGQTVQDIFAFSGETYFRELETEALNDFIHEDNIVIATGGGMPCFNDNVEQMNKSGITIYLKTDIGVLVSRLINGKNDRPLIKNKNKDELYQYIEESLSLREKYYNQSAIVIDGCDIKAEYIIDQLKEW